MTQKISSAIVMLLLLCINVTAQTVPSPKQHFGFNIGDDYKLANYTQTETYFKKVAASSNRAKLVDIGLTEEGRHQYMMIVSSPENIKNLNQYKEISQKQTLKNATSTFRVCTRNTSAMIITGIFT